MSITSICNPTALLSQVAGKSPLAAAASYAASSFASTLSQALHPSGTASSTASGAAAAGALQGHGILHGHHGATQLQALLQQQLRAGAAATPGHLSGSAG